MGRGWGDATNHDIRDREGRNGEWISSINVSYYSLLQEEERFPGKGDAGVGERKRPGNRKEEAAEARCAGRGLVDGDIRETAYISSTR